MTDFTARDVIHALELGNFDDDYDLNEIIRYAEWRKKITTHNSGIRKGAVCKVAGTGRSDLDGKHARVKRINKKSVSIVLLDENNQETYSEWRVPPSKLVAA